MPRVKLGEKPFDGLAKLIRGYANATTLSEKMGISYGTARSRLNNPGDITIRELREISLKLHIPKERIIGELKW